MRTLVKYGIAAMCLLFSFGTQTISVMADELDNTMEIVEAEQNSDEEEVLNDAFVVVESYEISHDKIIPGESFSLTLVLKNNSMKRSVQEALIDITNPHGIAPVYGTVSQAYLGDFVPGESKTVTFHYDSWSSITSETLDFAVVITSQGNTNYVTLRVPTGSDNFFNVMAVNGPSSIYEGEMTSISLNFRVLGEENVSDVVLRMECNGETIASSQVGSLTAGTTKTQNISYQIEGTGEYTVEFYMEYIGADGRSESEFLGTKQIEVNEVEKFDDSEQFPGDNTVDEEPDYTSMMFLILSGTLILAIFIVSAIILKKKR